ncbi:hypothetical protein GQ44DRAFT_53918 [Phaeosphaeriaceae sp. PMI808]|nr:hypothetical protein GQ44DRAFT_53918 [Phaeosphaeriaceae sp. PMI808]
MTTFDMRLSALRVWQCVSLLVVLVAVVRADCYSHDGILARNSKYYTGPELVSCGNGTNNCCLAGEKCGTNLLCSRGTANARQYCADKNWVGCSTMCPGNDAAGVSLKECPGNSNVYCCGTCDCTKNLFYVHPFTGEVSSVAEAPSKAATDKPTWWAVDSTAILAGSTSIARASSSIASAAVSSAASLTVSGSALSTGSSGMTMSFSAPTTTSPPAGATSNTGDNNAPAPSRGLSAGASAGIGVGCTLGAVALGVLGWLFVRERRKRKALQTPAGPAQPMHELGADGNAYNTNGEHYNTAPKDAYAQHGVMQRHELGSTQRHELS